MEDRGAGCPKEMVFGPCGGVATTGLCEVGDRLCPFVSLDAPPAWPDPPAPGPAVALPPVLVDLRPDPTLPRQLAAAVDRLLLDGVGVLIGDHADDPAPHPPGVVASAVADRGAQVVGTVACRGRSAAELDRAVARTAVAGVVAVHVVTGDHPRARPGLDRWPRFGLDSTRLAARAAALGIPVSVAESPATPPVTWRAERILIKERAGAGACLLNHAGAVADLVAFARACRDVGVTVPLVAPVPVVTDHRSAATLERFPGLRLPPGLVADVLAAGDPWQAGIAAAVAMARDLLASGSFAGVNLSGPGADAGLEARAELMATVAAQVLA